MPKATVHKNYALLSGENQIGASWQAAAVKAVSKAESVDKTPNNHFWLGVLPFYTAHPFAAFLR